MHGQLPNWVGFSKVCLIALVLCTAGAVFVRQLAPRFPKLAS